nr:restriction endonuclease subunit S [Sneathiella chungangensis]
MDKKNDLYKQGKIRKPKKYSDVSHAEIGFAVPTNWSSVRLGKIATKITDGSHNPPKNVGSGIPMLSSQNVNFGRIDFDNPTRFVTRSDYLAENERTAIEVGDVLLTIVASLGRSAVVPNNFPEFALQRSVAVVQTGLEPEFLCLLFQSPLCMDYFWRNAKGTAQKGIYLGKLAEMPIIVPPLAEQHRIVAKVKELMGLCDALETQTEDSLKAHQTLVETCLATLTNSQTPEDLSQNWARIENHFDTLFTTQESVKQLKNTVFKLAVSGHLVEQIEYENRSNQKNLRPDAQAEKYDLSAFEEQAKKFQLPKGWVIQPLSRVTSHIVDCPHTTPKWTDSGELCVKSNQIYARHLDLSEPNFVSSQTYLERIERLEPKEDDILYKREGGILGVGARIPKGTRVCLGQRLMLIRAGEAVLAEFLELVINSPWITNFAEEKTTGGAAPRVNMTLVRAYPIPVPPMDEQKRILRRVRDLVQRCSLIDGHMQSARSIERDLADALTLRIH